MKSWRIVGCSVLAALCAGCQTTPGMPVMPGPVELGECWPACKSLMQAELPECLSNDKARRYFYNSIVAAIGELDTSDYPDNACSCATMELAEGGRFVNFRIIETNIPEQMQAVKKLVESYDPGKPPPDAANCLIGEIWPVTLSD